MFEPIEVHGLVEFQHGVTRLRSTAPAALRQATLDAAGLTVDWARPRVPVRTGRARASVVVVGLARGAVARAGGPRAPYFPYIRGMARVLELGYARRQPEVHQRLSLALLRAVVAAGLRPD